MISMESIDICLRDILKISFENILMTDENTEFTFFPLDIKTTIPFVIKQISFYAKNDFNIIMDIFPSSDRTPPVFERHLMKIYHCLAMVGDCYPLHTNFAGILNDLVDRIHPIRIIETMDMIIFVDGIENFHCDQYRNK